MFSIVKDGKESCLLYMFQVNRSMVFGTQVLWCMGKSFTMEAQEELNAALQ